MYLRSHGAAVEVTDDADRAAFSVDIGIPASAASCHTALVDGYAIEGHVPAEAIGQLLATMPAAVGLALPGMPGDSPGMGGDTGAWVGQPVMLVSADGTLSAYDF